VSCLRENLTISSYGEGLETGRANRVPRQFLTRQEMFDEIKTHLCDGKKVLRSKTPDLVRQEFYALMLTHAAIRRLMYEAAQDSGQRPEDLSFVHAVRVLNRRLPEAAAIPP